MPCCRRLAVSACSEGAAPRQQVRIMSGDKGSSEPDAVQQAVQQQQQQGAARAAAS